jgi:hypothetical protein
VTRRASVSLAVATLVLIVAACGARTYVDGFPIGDPLCTGGRGEAWLCDGMTGFAQTKLDATDHAAVESVALYRPDYRGPNGETILHTRGTAGGEAIVVFRLADDAVRAFYVGCIAGPWGPAESPPPDGVHCDLMVPMQGES